jgi:hypothetical protein
VLTAADLLAGADAVREVEVPADLLGGLPATPADRRVRLTPLTVNDLRLIARAARDNDELTAALMVQRSLTEPALTVRDVARMPVGLLQFLLREVNAISGISASEEQVARAIEDPLAQAAFRLSQAFGWTPEQIGRLTMGEVLAHLQLLKSA